jgi:hypothetical protein
MLQLGSKEGTLCIIKLRPVPSISFPIHHSLIILPFDATQSQLLAASLHEPLINKSSKFNKEYSYATRAASFTVSNSKGTVRQYVFSYEIKHTMILKYRYNTFNNYKRIKFNVHDSEFLLYAPISLLLERALLTDLYS